MKRVLRGLKPLVFSALFGTTEVVPFQNRSFATGCWGISERLCAASIFGGEVQGFPGCQLC